MSLRHRGLAGARVLLLAACAQGYVQGDASKDSGTTGERECPQGVEGYCAYEFGGACPTYEEAAVMSCRDYHFDPTGSSGDPVVATDGDEDCSFPLVTCNGDDDPNLRTRFNFDGMGSGGVRAMDIIWPASDACPADLFLPVGDTFPC
jgi:hypothetical protein